jgi:DNA (cytosine-5)-methyltransferase 1
VFGLTADVDKHMARVESLKAKKINGNGAGIPLAVEVRRWPTPTAGDGKASGSRNLEGSRAHPGVRLTDADRYGNSTTPRWPTPTTRDHKDTGDSIANGTVPVNGLLGRAVGPSSEGGSLNPTWVEWLMGFPLGWTDCEHLATRSSRKSSKSSAGGSSK